MRELIEKDFNNLKSDLRMLETKDFNDVREEIAALEKRVRFQNDSFKLVGEGHCKRQRSLSCPVYMYILFSYRKLDQ